MLKANIRDAVALAKSVEAERDANGRQQGHRLR
jgi:hypothetical protein